MLYKKQNGTVYISSIGHKQYRRIQASKNNARQITKRPKKFRKKDGVRTWTSNKEVSKMKQAEPFQRSRKKKKQDACKCAC